MQLKRRHVLTLAAGALVTACAQTRHDSLSSAHRDAAVRPRAGREAIPRLPADRDVPIRYVALGDSTVEGIGASAPALTYVRRLHARLREVYARAEVENLGVGGATSADVVKQQLSHAVKRRPDLVTLSVGPNDITKRIGVDVFERNVQTIFRAVRARPETVVVATLLPDLGVTLRFRGKPEEPVVSRRSVEFNEALRRQAMAHGVALVDLYEPSRAEVPRRPELLADDGYHPSDIGYARWTELMWQVIAPLAAH